MNDKPSSRLLQIAGAFVRFANATFGGGSATTRADDPCAHGHYEFVAGPHRER
jgi:hypothetical protein